MEQNENTLDKLIESLRNDSPRLENPELMADLIMHRVCVSHRREAVVGILRRLSVAASVIAVIGFAWLQSAATEAPKTDPATLAYQEQACRRKPAPTEKDAYKNYLQKKIEGKNIYSLLKHRLYENED